MKKLNNKGFSLVELIIVIAIMVILVIAIAPTYLKFVHNSKISTDVQTAQALATAVDVSIASGNKAFSADNAVDYTKVDGVDAAPMSKLTGNNTAWTIYGKAESGVSQITLTVDGTTYEVYPNPESTGTTKGINNTVTNGGLKK